MTRSVYFRPDSKTVPKLVARDTHQKTTVFAVESFSRTAFVFKRRQSSSGKGRTPTRPESVRETRRTPDSKTNHRKVALVEQHHESPLARPPAIHYRAACFRSNGETRQWPGESAGNAGTQSALAASLSVPLICQAKPIRQLLTRQRISRIGSPSSRIATGRPA